MGHLPFNSSRSRAGLLRRARSDQISTVGPGGSALGSRHAGLSRRLCPDGRCLRCGPKHAHAVHGEFQPESTAAAHGSAWSCRSELRRFARAVNYSDFRDLNQPMPRHIQAGGSGLRLLTITAYHGCFAQPGTPPAVLLLHQLLKARRIPIYNSLQAQLANQQLARADLELNYTWSHSIDDASDGEDYVPNAAQPTDSTKLIE